MKNFLHYFLAMYAISVNIELIDFDEIQKLFNKDFEKLNVKEEKNIFLKNKENFI